jgi:hypothetical protein
MMQVKGFDRKGAQFFRFTTPITDDIMHLAVANTHLYVLTAYVLTIFEETSEQGSYVAPERINAIAMLPLGGAGQWCIALACQDRVIRLLNHTKVVQV